MRKTTAIFVVLMAGGVFGQSAATNATFVAADVHITPKEELPFSFQNLTPGNRIILRSMTLTRMVALAYGVDEGKVSGGPKWMDADRFDVIAKPPTTAKLPELRAMLQA